MSPGRKALFLMLKRLRSMSLAGSAAIALVLAVSGIVAAGSLLTAITAPAVDPIEPAVVDTTQTFEDVDGDGIDDDCDDAVEANVDAAEAADTAVDLDGDGTISTSEAAQSDRIGGVNCNHGGYVSTVAQAACDSAEEPATADGSDPGDETTTIALVTEEEPAAATCDEDADETADEPETTEPKVCEAAPAEEPAADEPVDTAPNAHGKAVSEVAQSDAVGGKNCNHGGAVSEVAKDHAARDAAKAAQIEARQAAKDARAAAKEARSAKTHGTNVKTHGNKHGG